MPSHTLGQQMLRTASIFQAIAAAITAAFQCTWVIDQFYYRWDVYNTYYAITAVCTTLLAVAILFGVLVQRNPNNTPFSIWCIEVVKSASATILWLWLLLDALFRPGRGSSNPQKVSLSAVTVLIVLIGFYPTLIYGYLYRKSEESLVVVDEEVDGEREPLLRA